MFNLTFDVVVKQFGDLKVLDLQRNDKLTQQGRHQSRKKLDY